MIKSMTGFGRAKKEIDGREYMVEIKSVNHKYSDITIKMPKAISYLEEMVKRKVLNYISRGKIDVSISLINNSTKGKNVSLNVEMAKMYIEELENLASNTNIKDDISIMEIAKLPDVLNIRNEEDEEETIWKELEECLEESINIFLSMRIEEGKKISEDLINRIDNISKEMKEISKISTRLIDEYVVKLESRIKEILKTDIDKERLAQEVVIYADKCSIQEELIRMNSHIAQFKTFFNDDRPVGKKIDFLIQEMNREINTIGSKANCLDITNLVVEIKTEIENIREQTQNIE